MSVSIQLATDERNWWLRCQGGAARDSAPFAAIVTGFDKEWKYKRDFLRYFRIDPGPTTDMSTESLRRSYAEMAYWYQLTPRPEPYLLDIRHEVRWYYCVYCRELFSPEICEIGEFMLAELLNSQPLQLSPAPEPIKYPAPVGEWNRIMTEANANVSGAAPTVLPVRVTAEAMLREYEGWKRTLLAAQQRERMAMAQNAALRAANQRARNRERELAVQAKRDEPEIPVVSRQFTRRIKLD